MLAQDTGFRIKGLGFRGWMWFKVVGLDAPLDDCAPVRRVVQRWAQVHLIKIDRVCVCMRERHTGSKRERKRACATEKETETKTERGSASEVHLWGTRRRGGEKE